MNRGAWPAIVHGVPQSQTQLSNQAQHMLGIQQWVDGGRYLASFNMTVGSNTDFKDSGSEGSEEMRLERKAC